MHFQQVATITICLLSCLGAPQFLGGPPVNAQAQSSLVGTSGKSASELIEQLGHDNYLMRSRAREQLQIMGLEAFDELHAARFHSDPEVVSAARFLISSLLVSWSKETDPTEVRDALSEYGAQDANERASRIELLAKLPGRNGMEALVRLVRFEPDLKLSRKAALAVMEQTMSDDQAERKQRSKVLLGVIKDNDRQASQWLRVYAKDLAGGIYSVDDWRNLLRRQRREIDAANNQQASRESVLELVRICAARALKNEHRNEAIRLASSNIDLVQPTTRALLDACSWAIDHKLHEFVLELQKKNTRMFEAQPRLLYGAAEAEKISGNQEAAENIAQRALAINGIPSDPQEKEKLSDNELSEIAQTHLEVAADLKERGLYDWAEDEFSHIIDSVEITSAIGAYARGRLAFMQGELLRHEDVVKTLGPMFDRMDKDDELKQRLNGRLNIAYYRSELDFHRGMMLLKTEQLEDARKSLQEAYEIYPANVDILIAMFRVDGDDDWERLVNHHLKNRVRQIESEIRVYELKVRQRGQRSDDVEQLSQALNEYAWLVSNTAGDQERALRESLRSLELTPDDAAKVDTCARCYLSLGKLREAAKTQRRAVELMPNSPPMIRQLEEIERRIEEERK